MDKPDNWLDDENCFFDATIVEETEPMSDTWPCDEAHASDVSAEAFAKADAKPSTGKRRVIMIGFLAIRL